ncbi:MAG: hypothetical protein HYS25_00165 [Ignavibacteriales bacterium]|nr:hypothetical protein [Ignavibacteriales bacterium]
MRTIKILLSIFIPIFCLSINAQTKSKISGDAYKTKRDSLLTIKKEFTASRVSLKNEIDSLKRSISSLDDKIQNAEEEIHELYYKKFGKETGKRIINKQVWKGMTEKMLTASWGRPDKVDKNVEKWGVFTQWHYGNAAFFFRDGKLTDFEEIKQSK